MATTPLSLLMSRSKWSKLWLLVREIYLSVGFRVGTQVDYEQVENTGHTTGILDSASYGEQSLHSPCNQREIPTMKCDWHYHTKVSVSADVLTHSAIDYGQDQLSNGEISVEHTYQLAELGKASICSNGTTHVSIFGNDDLCLPQFSYRKYGRNRRVTKPKRRHLAISRFISGRTLNLYGNVENTAGNYGHWMVDGVGLLYLALTEYSIDDFDHFLVPTLRYDFQKESLLMMGIPDHKILELPALSCFQCESLVCASAPRGQSSGLTPGWLIDGYRRTFLSGKKSTNTRLLYISRRDANSRKFTNESDIVRSLELQGFEIIELSKYSFMEKVELFADAKVVVGLTGAGLTNLMFCSKDASVLEIFPRSFVTYFYASMAGYLGLNYRALILDNSSVLSNVNKYYGNLVLRPEKLNKTLKNLL